MKTLLFIIFVLYANIATANEYPQYFEKNELNHYCLILFRDSSSATYIERQTLNDGEVYFYFDDQATWGELPKIYGKRTIPSIWIKSNDFLVHYYFKNSNLIEHDKTGDTGVFVRIKNHNNTRD